MSMVAGNRKNPVNPVDPVGKKQNAVHRTQNAGGKVKNELDPSSFFDLPSSLAASP